MNLGSTPYWLFYYGELLNFSVTSFVKKAYYLLDRPVIEIK